MSLIEVRATLDDESGTRRAGQRLARALLDVAPNGFLMTLSGELGAGKTTFMRGLLEALGVAGPIRSPTYTLIETYPVGDRQVAHLDWYRLGDESDLEGLGFRDLWGEGGWIFAEWPEQVPAVAALADVALGLGYQGVGRALTLRARTPTGQQVLSRL